jgi:aerobic-type carbon monoxide dehydrogenase small subunit (CoxS/CutS family)
MKVRFTLNGQEVDTQGRASDRLLDVLRRDFGLTGTKEGCGEGECGACTVLMDGDAVLSCLTPLIQADGRAILTVEGLDASSRGAEFIERFAAAGGTQCGACTPGIVLSAAKYLSEAEEVGREGIRRALAGNICRCTGYEAIVRAIEEEGQRGDRAALAVDSDGSTSGGEGSS